MEKEGFIYIWYDRKHKRYYIGSHWGTLDDGYICSSSWMKQGYKHRPNDFKRKILKRNIERTLLLQEEYNWLKLIKQEELGKKYYNLHNHHFGHWSNNENNKLTIREKIIKKLSDPLIRKKISDANKGKNITEKTKQKIKEKRAKQIYTEETKKKISESHKGEKNHFFGKTHSKETKEKMSAAKKGKIGRKHSDETKQRMSELAKNRMKTEEGKKQLMEAYKRSVDIRNGKP